MLCAVMMPPSTSQKHTVPGDRLAKFSGIVALLGGVLGILCFVSAANYPVNDGFSAASQGIALLCGVAHLAIPTWGLAFWRARRPWPRGVRRLWILWATITPPLLAIGLVVAAGFVQRSMGR